MKLDLKLVLLSMYSVKVSVVAVFNFYCEFLQFSKLSAFSRLKPFWSTKRHTYRPIDPHEQSNIQSNLDSSNSDSSNTWSHEHTCWLDVPFLCHFELILLLWGLFLQARIARSANLIQMVPTTSSDRTLTVQTLKVKPRLLEVKRTILTSPNHP